MSAFAKGFFKNVIADQKRKLCRDFGKEVDEVQYPDGGVCTSIFLDSDTFMFSTAVGEDTFRSKDGNEVRKWARKQLEGISNLKWVPVITVLDSAEQKTNYHHGNRKLDNHAIAIDLHRCYVAQLPNGTVRMADWEATEDQRLKSRDHWNWPTTHDLHGGKTTYLSPDALPHHDDNFHVLLYSDAMWVALNKVAEAIDTLRNNLHNLICTEEGQRKLMTIGLNTLLLGPPSD